MPFQVRERGRDHDYGNITNWPQHFFGEEMGRLGSKGESRNETEEVAVARAHPENPPILQAVDSGWWNHRDALHQNGVTIDFICQDDIRLSSQ